MSTPANDAAAAAPQLPQTTKTKRPATLLTQLSTHEDSFHLRMNAKVWKGKGVGIHDGKGTPSPFQIIWSGTKDPVWGRSLLVKETASGRIIAVIRRFYEPGNIENYLFHICGFIPAYPGQEPWHEKATFEGHTLFIWATMYSKRHEESFVMTLAANEDTVAKQKAVQYETVLEEGRAFTVVEQTQAARSNNNDSLEAPEEGANAVKPGREVAKARMEGSRLKGGRTWDIRVGQGADPALMAAFVMLVEKTQRHRGADGFFSWASRK